MDIELSMAHHPTYPRPSEPIVKKNRFRNQALQRDPVIPFKEARSLLPVPILPDHYDWQELYWRTWEMAWNNIKRPKRSSGLVSRFIDPAFNENIFMWDTAFMVQFGAYGRRAFPFINSLDNFYARQHDDGAICREINKEEGYDYFSPFDPDGTGPNIMAWAEWRHYRISGDEQRLGQVFWPLLAYHRWFRANRSWPNGLYWATGLSSGMDNQPRVPEGKRHHQHWTWVDASMQAAVNCLSLERIANQLGEKEYAAELAAEHGQLRQAINRHLWNEKSSFYQDLDAQREFSQAKSIGAYWGLLDKALVPEERLGPFVRHLREAGVFKVKHRIPSLSADSEGYDGQTGNYWCGAVWSPTNFMVLKGLESIGQNALAHEIACNHIRNVAAVFEHTDTLWENYAPESVLPGKPARPNFVGYTGLTPIAMLFEDIIGLWVDWPTRRVVWNRMLETERHYGVQKYPLGPEGTLSLLGNQQQVTITTDVSFTLTIRDRSLDLQIPMSAGTREVDLT
ncbi:MAG: trehalase family glycosidase [Candidatus Promineifilaceae bacterium]|nr:trehalase family glycosidase [Candidatus Promineifilaceae bacterium]